MSSICLVNILQANTAANITINDSVDMADDTAINFNALSADPTVVESYTNINGLLSQKLVSGTTVAEKLSANATAWVIQDSSGANQFTVGVDGDTTLADDAVLALSTSNPSLASVMTLTSPQGNIADLFVAGNENGVKLKNTNASWSVRSNADAMLLNVNNDGIITGVTGITASITNGSTDGKVISSVGIVYSARNGTGVQAHYNFYNANSAGSPVGSISTSGTATAFNVSSDPRLKDFLALPDDTEINSEWSKAYGALAKFTFKSDPSKEVYGFDAHKAIDAGLRCGLGSEGEGPRDAELDSDYDTGEVDENGDAIMAKVTPAGVDQSKLVPLLMLKIEQLEARIAQLEAGA